jgi:hypothetical protein
VQFGTHYNPLSDAATLAMADNGVDETAVAADTVAEPEADSSGSISRVGFIVLGVALVLIILAGIGVFLLRQS